MKKLMTVLTAVAVAIGLQAADTGTSFEGMNAGPLDITSSTGELSGESGFWVTNGNDKVVLNVVADESVARTYTAIVPKQFDAQGQTKYLNVQTPLGNAVKRNVKSGGSGQQIGDGFYFDSLVKFTTFDQDPTTLTDFSGSKIAVWLQETNTVGGATCTNLYVYAGYVGPYGVPKVYDCGQFSGADDWHRLTIKAIANIYKPGDVDYGECPGFVVFVDGQIKRAPNDDTGIAGSHLNDKYSGFYNESALFPSMDKTQTGTVLSSVEFDGQGDVDDLVFTGSVPFDNANDAVFVSVTWNPSDIMMLQINGSPVDVSEGSAKLVYQGAGSATISVSYAEGKMGPGMELYGDNPITFEYTSAGDSYAIVASDAAAGIGVGRPFATLEAALAYANTEVNATDTLKLFNTTAEDDISINNINNALIIIDLNGQTVGGIETITPVDIIDSVGGGKVEGFVTLGTGSVIEAGKFNATENSASDLKQYAPQGYEFRDDDGDGYLTLAEEIQSGWTLLLGEPDPVDGAYTIDDAADLIALANGVNTEGLDTTDVVFKQTMDIDMSEAGAFAGIGEYADNPTSGTAFKGTYDGQGYKISNVTFTDRDYAGIFNQVNGGVIQNLTVENVTFVGTGSKYSASIIGNAGNGAFLQNLMSAGSFGSAEKPGNHNMAGIAIRLSAGGNGTYVLNCTNNAAIYGTYTKLAGICAITQTKVTGGFVTFDGCVNNGSLNLSRTSNGVTGFAGIVGYVQDDTILIGCSNTGSINNTANGANTDKNGALVGWAYGKALMDNGGNSAAKTDKMVGCQTAGTSGQSISGFKYATVENNVATTTSMLSVGGNTYLLEGNIAADDTPVFTLSMAGDSIAFDTALGYTFSGTIAVAEGLELNTETVGTVTTYTAAAPAPTGVAQINDVIYETLKEAVEAASEGDTVRVLRDCTVDEPIVFSYGIDLTNDYTISIEANYALRIANGLNRPVHFKGAGSIVWNGGAGSPVLVGSNEAKSDYGINGTYTGSLYLDGGTIAAGTATDGDLVKVENGNFFMEGGSVIGGKRCIKADADAGNANASVNIINGVVSNTTSAAVMASAESANGIATVLIQGGTISGVLTKDKTVGSVTLEITTSMSSFTRPKFDRDQNAFCDNNTKTVLVDGWYEARVKEYYGWAGFSVNELAIEIPAAASTASVPLTLSLMPSSAADDSIIVTSSDPTVATWANDFVTALKAGTTTLTATNTANGMVKATCTITVTKASAPTIDPATEAEITIPAESIEAAEAAVVLTPPAESGIETSEDLADYKDLFDITVTSAGEGSYTVTVNGLKPEVEKRVDTAAVAALTDSEVESVTIPKGLYYRITPSADLKDWNQSAAVGDGQTPSTGSVDAPVIDYTNTDPQETVRRGFYKVEIDYKPFQ